MCVLSALLRHVLDMYLARTGMPLHAMTWAPQRAPSGYVCQTELKVHLDTVMCKVHQSQDLLKQISHLLIASVACAK